MSEAIPKTGHPDQSRDRCIHLAHRLGETDPLQLHAIDDGPVPSEIVSEHPRIRVRYSFLPTSGLSYWDGQHWIIRLNIREPHVRQRYTLFHEYKHVIDHGQTSSLYRGGARNTPERQAEHAADYFAACVLMPARLVRRAWGQGLRRPVDLAAKFDVSERAMEIRLIQLGLTEPRRHLPTRPTWGPRNRKVNYYRQHPDTGQKEQPHEHDRDPTRRPERGGGPVSAGQHQGPGLTRR